MRAIRARLVGRAALPAPGLVWSAREVRPPSPNTAAGSPPFFNIDPASDPRQRPIIVSSFPTLISDSLLQRSRAQGMRQHAGLRPAARRFWFPIGERQEAALRCG